MSWYPLFVQLEGRRCLVVGGGAVARRKAEGLLEAGALVLAVSPEFSPGFEDLAWQHRQRLLLERQPYAPRDLSGLALVIAATDSTAVNAAVAEDARRAGVWVNVVDTPAECTVQAAAVVRRGPLQVAIHTGGEFPALSAVLRAEREHDLDPWLEPDVHSLGRVRAWLLGQEIEGARRAAILRRLADPELRRQCHGLDENELVERFTEEARRGM
jgi:siroheme synthase-like protein